MYYIVNRKGLSVSGNFHTIKDLFKALQIVCLDNFSSTLAALLKTPNGGWFRVVNDGYEMTEAELEYLQGEDDGSGS